MFLLTLFLAGVFIALGTALFAAWSDFKGLQIPNLYSVIILGAFFVTYAVLWIGGRDDVFSHPVSHLLAALLVFLVTLGMFALKGLGAGDSKMATACSLWCGLLGLMPFLFYMAVTGGFLALGALALRKWTPVKNPPEGSWIAQVQAGESKVPYGIAIAAGMLASFVELGYFNGDVLSSFLLGS